MPRSRWLSPLVGFFVAAAILVAVAVFVAVSTVRYTRDSRWVSHTYAVMNRIASISALENRAIGEQRGYLLIQSPEARKEFWKAGTRAQVELRELLDLVADNPGQVLRARALEQALEARMGIASGVMGTLDGDGLGPAQERIRAGAGMRAQAEFDQFADQMQGVEQQLLIDRTHAMERLSLWVLVGSILGIVTSLMILASIYSLLSRENRERLTAEGLVTDSNAELNRSVARLEKLSTELAGLGRYAGMLQSAATVEELIEITGHSMRTLVPELSGAVYLSRASRDHAERVISWGEPPVQSEAMPTPDQCWALRRNQVYVVDDLATGVRCAHVEAPRTDAKVASACIPLAAQGESIGWMFLCGEGPLTGLELAINVCEQFSLGLASLRLKESLRHQAIRDPLTGLFNRRYMEESLTRELARCKRRTLPLAVMMFDLDHFKRFNDTCGHSGGDALLAAFGALVRTSCRGEDIPCRYGGEEFTLILPDTTLEIALERAESIRKAASALDVPHQGGSLPPVTVSIGVSAMPNHGELGQELLEAADKALYSAKERGRNRVEAAFVADERRSG